MRPIPLNNYQRVIFLDPMLFHFDLGDQMLDVNMDYKPFWHFESLIGILVVNLERLGNLCELYRIILTTNNFVSNTKLNTFVGRVPDAVIAGVFLLYRRLKTNWILLADKIFDVVINILRTLIIAQNILRILKLLWRYFFRLFLMIFHVCRFQQ